MSAPDGVTRPASPGEAGPIRPASPREAGALALLTASHGMMRSLFPPQSCHALSVDELCAPEIRFFLWEEAGVALGCGALALRAGYGEVKSMFTAPEGRGRGIARAMLTRIETEARAAGLPVLRLETAELLASAIRLYEAAGFRRCGPFGDYVEDPLSTFMEKPL